MDDETLTKPNNLDTKFFDITSLLEAVGLLEGDPD